MSSAAISARTDVFAERYRAVRAHTDSLTATLSAEDAQIQSMPDVSPAKWHLAHTTWFFETFLLKPLLPEYVEFDSGFAVLFNSYYVGVGNRHPRADRGLISRPTLDRLFAYRSHVDLAMEQLMNSRPKEEWASLAKLGCQHEQQDQELILMDIQHVMSCNPLDPVYDPQFQNADDAMPLEWHGMLGGLYEVGHDDDGFAFDNETPRHRIWLEPFSVASTLVTCAQYMGFIDDGGYERPELWLSDGWAAVETQDWIAPLYWRKDAAGWTRFLLRGRCPVDPADPVQHISYYEADAYARWASARLPTEAEWEIAATRLPILQLYGYAWQ